MYAIVYMNRRKIKKYVIILNTLKFRNLIKTCKILIFLLEVYFNYLI